MLEKIFGSRTRVKLLRLFLTQTQKEFFVRQLARVIREQINSVRRELKNLEELGILTSMEKDKKKYYTARSSFALFDELRAIFLKSRLTLEKEFIQSIRSMGSISYLALTGYFVNDETAKVDLFIVGEIQRRKLDGLLEKFKAHFGEQLRFTIMTPEEFVYRKDITDKFLYEMLNGKKIVVLDKFKKS